MSRRAPNPAAERAAQNQATIKNLLKLEANKICSDCKKNKHPRWASWNLGVFICIRCSGIHRGMGTHISRVKSVDLDSWTDEQLQSVLRWGNARANRYWEAKLAAGHAPSEAKIENFIRTKYELKRWVMDGPMPDPATLDGDDDDVPLSLVREKQVIEKKETARKASIGQAARPSAVGDLIGGGADSGPAAPRTAASPAGGIKGAPAPPKTTTTKDSLLGLDFLGESSAPPRPASTPAAQAQSRPDLKQSILSLYATAPKPPPQQQQTQQQPQNGGGWGSPQMGNHRQQPSQGGGFADAFGGLSLSNPTSPKPPAADPFAGLGSGMGSRAPQHASNNSSSAFGGLGGGSFFDSKPAPQPIASQGFGGISNNQFASTSSGGFGDFASPVASAPAPSKPAQPAAPSSAMGDLFDLSAPVSQSSPPPVSPPATAPAHSVFNLSAPQSKPATSPAATAPIANTGSLGGFGGAAGLSGVDAWGGNEWATPAPAPVQATSPPIAAAAQPAASKPVVSNDMGWGASSSAFANTPIIPGAGGGFSPAPKVTADEEFGGWASSTGMGGQSATTSGAPKSGGGFGGDDDLFSNVWQ
ncbi:stromal membrane-associated protein [Cordyceps fumosorosea ARSEF 2679]|uniref:Stromal membrane-associated protein n=1 Tax=Cordyceps fumosorosea (strain ARSEF 2679) TaxID=1081104 RepID=A0A168BMR8_CORFA|nr:stromal membrane-associated protein [Cordyceps fumosorosea ARSEF 2679]OAA70318.1 stromal membrane-associated protein [Cordyceps fumosorosea ARSEF 2679]